MAEGSSNEVLYPPKKRLKSAVWEHFGFHKNDQGVIQDDGAPVCKTCRKKVMAKGSNTSNLIQHLRDHHPRLHALIKPNTTSGIAAAGVNQSTVAESFAKCVTYAPSSKQAQDLNNAVAYFISKDMMPFQIVEKPGFLHLMKKAVPQYKVPSRSYFSANKIPAMYKEVRASVEEQLAEGVWFGATTDLWTSTGGGGEPFMSCTVHYISSDWKLKCHCLETLYFPEDHTAEHITEMMENMLLDWNIKKESLSGITTDNASNMRKAFETFPCVWFSCFGHNLNLAISKVLKISRVESAIRSCRHLVQGFSRSWKRKRELHKKQEELNIAEHSLIHDVVTRWGSTFEMISRFLEQQQAICAVLVGNRSTWHLMPKDSDITVLEEVHKLLCPLHDFTDILASERQVTLSALQPVLEHINSVMLQDEEEDSALTKQMKHVIRDDLLMQLRYTTEMKNVLSISSFIDPRFKGSFAENLDDIVKACSDEATALTAQELPDTEQPPAAMAQSTNSTTTTKRKEKSLSGLLQKITTARKNRSAAASEGPLPTALEKLDTEMRLYLSLPAIDAEADPLSWWKTHVEEFPMLSKVARKYLCIPATSVPSERVFSASGHILSPQRSRLSTENVNMLTFLHFNMN
ncbi:zinc finger BED domain-containing protein 1-like [Notolabrus celidotus]|uniref:zinc finger BED domain-containing protein 1-like n=1 Tax=Notolabrus celidotus TaxID=1203425 RepID=UPI00148F68CA|nr:zinc finger BED domain-containing protein 1-like [Notolabrus celidotus]XP_034564415.1 zinc finger BED domain-containing protein 1-like [Notolabrus celidotus]